MGGNRAGGTISAHSETYARESMEHIEYLVMKSCAYFIEDTHIVRDVPRIKGVTGGAKETEAGM